MSGERPVVLAIGGHDPSGGAGIQADIESIHACGGRAVTLVTTLTAQNSKDFIARWPGSPDDLARQLDCLLEDIVPAVVKIGLLGSPGQVEVIAARLRPLGIPLVLDPVLFSGSGRDLADRELVAALGEWLLPLTTVLTPNRPEAERLTGSRDPATAARALLDAGARNVLVTGGHDESGLMVINRLYGHDGSYLELACERLPAVYHGSGCTLASAIATSLARGLTVATAVRQAQGFTYECLKRSIPLGNGQRHPQRL